jgi:UDP-GlcNAc:undecaprenyl-phosphate GlcNAc-1-phosphate transferase
MSYVVSAAVAIGVTCVLLLVLRPLALRIGLVDHPGERKHHNGAVPLTGGIAMFCGIVFSVLMLETSLAGYRSFFAGATLLIIVGILDDFRELPVWVRFAAQVGAALLMTVGGGVVVSDFGAISGSGRVELGAWAVPFTVFATVGVINALNMSDGVDGLAGSISFVAFVLLAYIAMAGERSTDALVLLLLACTVGAFLLFNARFPGRRAALAFMGDAGSMFLGFMLAWFAISLSQGERAPMTPVTALWILALPLIDAVSIIFRRVVAGKSPFEASKDHCHHLLLWAGGSVNATVAVLVGATLVAGALGILGLYAGMAESMLFVGFLTLFALHLWVMTGLSKALARRNPPS